MSEIWIPAAAGGGGVTSDDVTALKKHILKGERTITQDSNDEVIEGELEVNSLLSFSVAAYSGRRVLAKWQNPNQAAGKPYSGVMIRYSTSGYPGINEGTQIYKGAGNNTASGGLSQAFLDLPNLNTKYFFSIFPYVTTNKEDMIGSSMNAQATTSGTLNKTFTAGGSYTIPEGYSKMDAFCVGGGGGGGYGYGDSSMAYLTGGGGGGGGFTKTVKGITISPNQKVTYVIGSGGAEDKNGNVTSVTRDNVTLCTANGGQLGKRGSGNGDGGKGGSGGGDGGYDDYEGYAYHGGNGGSNGGHGTGGPYASSSNNGQGTTTRSFGENSGNLYSGGGGGGGGSFANPGNGGSGGGGKGGYQSAGASGGTNTGGGGGGGGATRFAAQSGGKGGSGIILIRLY